MAKLSDLIKQKTTTGALGEFKIPEGTDVIGRVFTDDVVNVSLHYGESETLRGYFQCLGEGCPFCLAGRKVSAFFLLPIYSVAADSIQILRLSESIDPLALLPQILAVLEDPRVEDKFQVFHRLDKYHYSVESRTATDRRHLGASQINAFIEAVESGKIDLTNIFPRPSREDMLSVEAIRLHLELIGKIKTEGSST
jgi:hypothetical protein